MPTVITSPAGVPVSECHKVAVEITRVVRDVIGYEPVALALALGGMPPQLTVRHSRYLRSLDSDEFVVRCAGCEQELTGVEVEET